MDAFGIESAILSLTVAGDYLYDGTDKSTRFARESNEYGAKAVQLNPKRFGFFASLPATNIDASLKEIAYAFDTLKCDGVALFTNTGDKWWGDPMFLPIFDELNRRKAAVFFHPIVGNCCHNLAGLGDGVVEFDFDTTRTVVSLLYNGVLSRCQDIKWISTTRAPRFPRSPDVSGTASPAGRATAGMAQPGRPARNPESRADERPHAGDAERRELRAEAPVLRMRARDVSRCRWRRCARSRRRRSSCSAPTFPLNRSKRPCSSFPC